MNYWLIILLFFCAKMPILTASIIHNNAYVKINTTLMEGSLVDYEKLKVEAGKLNKVVANFCSVSGEATITNVRQQLVSTVRSWARVEHILFGPVTESMQRYRIYYWPDRRNMLTKQLNRFLGAADYKALDQIAFAKGSVALQGLSALERLLYSHKDLFSKKISGMDPFLVFMLAESHRVSTL